MAGFREIFNLLRATLTGYRALSCLLLLFAGVGGSAAETAPNDEETLLKVAYIYNFAKFTRWEEGAEGGTLRICALGRDSLADSLQRLAGKWVGERRITVATPKQPHSAECHIIYFSRSYSTQYRTELQGLAGQPLLTISEFSGFASNGGMIELFEEQGRIRFRVNLKAVETGGLTLSSRLLNLAEIVGDEVP